VVLIGTGSELGLAMAARTALAEKGIAARVVSMPCMDVFLRQDQAYRDAVLPHGVPRVAVEAGVSDIWRKYVLDGAVVGMDCFGESGSASDLFRHFGFTVEGVIKAVKSTLPYRLF